ncbi:tail fiber assembly protein [Xenorhabdus eapokensis]|uniref:Tail assembly chaperone n=1 Tax=Xenorhabdus eapokensis TaxID=1873482 RepID=A0A1Q5TUR2_9GAMM|nr:tail fiber assembly protein [Xenorhabdus eapokensis]OKP03933.1 tail assembly chaperone [Xenorhabdus eapokensis]
MKNIQHNKTKRKFDNDWFYSAAENGFVYRPYDEQGSYPDDVKPITDELYKKMFAGQSAGKRIVAGADGLPTLMELPPPTPEQLQQQAEQEKRYRMSQAANSITPLQYAVDLNMATDTEQSALIAWKKYTVLLNRVDCSAAPNIDWPKTPK